MARRQGDTHLAMIQRRDQVREMLLHSAKLTEMAKALKVTEQTIRADVDFILEEWRKDVAIKTLWGFKQAFDHLDVLGRELWQIFYEEPRKIKTKQGVITVDRSGLKVMIIANLLGIVKEKNVMRGIGTPKVFEQIKFLETERARGFEITTISYHDQLKSKVERARKDLEWQRRQGIIREPTDIIDIGERPSKTEGPDA